MFPDIPIGCRVPTSTASSDSFAWAQRKLQRCQALHKSCGKLRHGNDDDDDDDDVAIQQRVGDIGGFKTRSGPPPGPKRLLQIPHRLGCNQIRLCEVVSSSNDGIEARTCVYAALSHCWGREPFPRTTTANVTAHTHYGIAWDALPRTFQEAIDFTRRLGLRYIWIDSLCIIQDDPSDWEHESACMATIYQNACLVVSASHASGAHDGLYSDAAGSPEYATHVVNYTCADTSLQEEQRVKVVDTESPACTQVAFRRSYAHLPSPIQNQLQVSPTLPTLSRGWIYQERLLARRVLHFGPQELHWECMTESICQCRDTADNRDDDDDRSSKHQPPSAASRKPEFSIDHWKRLESYQLSVAWHRLVENYTALNLSYERDIFPALSGIAQTFQTVKQSRYLAGLWQSSALLDLLWYPNPPPFDFQQKNQQQQQQQLPPWQHRPTPWRAPSWSWASVRGPVEYVNTHNGIEPLCSLVECDVRLAGVDETGQLLSGHLVLQGRAMRTRATLRALLPPDDQLEKYRPWNLLHLDILQDHVANVWADCNWSLLPAEDLPSNTLLCFLVGECKPSGALTLLVLRPSNEASASASAAACQVYERVGLAQISKPPSRQNSVDYWLQMFPMETITVRII